MAKYILANHYPSDKKEKIGKKYEKDDYSCSSKTKALKNKKEEKDERKHGKLEEKKEKKEY